ncbi:hypothetical protein BEN47_17825 [Hymenobacter lapidarius]|uniref:Uncharacterized protein n=1 Tax=Hymenobacter lapidarius TaxID=1908237 RepID=A0A1G1SX02_9BACT|nr:hypothetical protein [Hymenobacter lapidarius]OGX83140.1 hypothetical protein BEN47_17825 [Hymenobacter lapidarius]
MLFQLFNALGLLQESSRMAEMVVETVRKLLLVLDSQPRALAVSHAFATLFRLDAAQAKGKLPADLDGGIWRQPALRQRLEAVLRDPTTIFDDYIFNGEFPEAGHRELLVYGRCIVSTGALSSKLLLGIKDMTPA